MSADALRAAIETTLRRRDPEAQVIALDARLEGLVVTSVSIVGVRMRASAPETIDALRALALACGLHVTDDGVTDPAEECERMREHLAAAEALAQQSADDAATVAVERDAAEAQLEEARADLARVTAEREAALDALYEYAPRCRNCGCVSTRVGGDYVALCDSDSCALGVPDVHDVTHSDALRAVNPFRGAAPAGESGGERE